MTSEYFRKMSMEKIGTEVIDLIGSKMEDSDDAALLLAILLVTLIDDVEIVVELVRAITATCQEQKARRGSDDTPSIHER